MNFPNLLTLCRIFLVPLLVAVLLQDSWRIRVGVFSISNEFLAVTIFLLAALTDLLDGYLARRWGQVTTVGTLLDPIADKLLISSALISLVQMGLVPAWMAIVIIGREFAVNGLRSIASSLGLTIPASDIGKTKMVFQVAAVTVIILAQRWETLYGAGLALLWGVMAFAVLSAVEYFAHFWRDLDEQVKRRGRRELLLLEARRKKEQLLREHADKVRLVTQIRQERGAPESSN